MSSHISDVYPYVVRLPGHRDLETGSPTVPELIVRTEEVPDTAVFRLVDGQWVLVVPSGSGSE